MPSPGATPTLHVRSPAPSALQSARDARDSLSAVGFEPPAWAELLHAQVPALPEDDPSLDQRPASQAVDDFCHKAFLQEADAASAALLDSQAGPHAARVLTTRPTLPEFTLESPLPQTPAAVAADLCQMPVPRNP